MLSSSNNSLATILLFNKKVSVGIVSVVLSDTYLSLTEAELVLMDVTLTVGVPSKLQPLQLDELWIKNDGHF